MYLYSIHAEPRDIILLLSMALAIIIPADILRLHSPGFERFYERCLGFLMRESEKVRVFPFKLAHSKFFDFGLYCLHVFLLIGGCSTETNERGHLVPHRCHICTFDIPQRHCCRIYPHVRLHHPSSSPSSSSISNPGSTLSYSCTIYVPVILT